MRSVGTLGKRRVLQRTDAVVIAEISFGPSSLKPLGTHHAKRCEGPASQGKRVHFRKVRKMLSSAFCAEVCRKDFLKAEKAEAAPSAGRR
jgi:hypothetical protein